jgi:polygalacturonase
MLPVTAPRAKDRPTSTALVLLGAGCIALAALAGCGARRTVSTVVAAGHSVDPELPPEPEIPRSCVSLSATKRAVNGNLSTADETQLDTARIQEALQTCAPGYSVRLKADGDNNAFLSGPLDMVEGVTLWIDANTTLFASRNPRDYDIAPGKPTCGTDAYDESGGCRALINVNKVSDVGVVGDGAIDGRGGEPMLGTDQTWWDVAQDAKAKDLKHSNPRLIEVKKARHFTLYRVTLYDSPKFHVVIGSEGFVVWGATILTPSKPTNSQGRPLTPAYARNTDGVDPSTGTDGIIAYSNISVGDDQIAIKGGNAGPTMNLVVAHNHFGCGHGMSIGSETNGGVSNIKVYDLTVDGTVGMEGKPDKYHNGLRIKSDPSRGGLVTDVSYTDVCIRDVMNPILITPLYANLPGADIPDYKMITINNVTSIKSPGLQLSPIVTLKGYDANRLLDVTLNNVNIEGIEPANVKAAFANVALGPGPVNFTPAGDGVTVKQAVTSNPAPYACAADKFPAFSRKH